MGILGLEELVQRLDPHQRAAAQSVGQRIRLRTGAGGGKTVTLTARVAWLRQEVGVQPQELCVVTFSKKAGDELVSRLGPYAVGAQVGTLHSLGFQILREEFGYRQIADEGMRRRILQGVFADLKIRDFPFSEAMRDLRRAKSQGLEFPSRTSVATIAYQTRLSERRLWDFDDLVLLPARLFRDDPEIRAKWQGRWRFIMVDEVQDTSELQWDMIDGLLHPEYGHLFVVGDVSQSIYGFRGAMPSAMLQLERRYGTFEDFSIPSNYRSTGSVVRAANRVIDGKPGAVMMEAARGDGVPIVLAGPCPDMLDEAEAVTQWLAEHHGAGVPWAQMAVLYRTNAQSEAIESLCVKKNIPAVVVGGTGFYGRQEVLDVLAYLRLAVENSAEAADRVYNKPSRYLGKAWRAELEAQGGWPAFFTAFESLKFSKGYMKARARDLYEAIQDLRLTAAESDPAGLVASVRGPEIGYEKWLLGEEPDDLDNLRAENLGQLQAAAARWKDVPSLLAFARACAAPRRESDLDFDRVQLSSIHRSKGLEWPVVALIGVDPGHLPHPKGDPDEERRVFYVGVTRARDHLMVSCVGAASPLWLELRVAEDGGDDAAAAVGLSDGGAGDSGDTGDGDRPDDAAP